MTLATVISGRRILGVDQTQLGGHFDEYLGALARQDPDHVVACATQPTEETWEIVDRFFSAGIEVSLVRDRANAPEGTQWLDVSYESPQEHAVN